jgi:hypothetical protein
MGRYSELSCRCRDYQRFLGEFMQGDFTYIHLL